MIIFPRNSSLGWLLLMLITVAASLYSQTIGVSPTVIIAEESERGVTYMIDSCKTEDILGDLIKIANNKGANHSIIVLVDTRLPIRELWNVAGIADKAGLTSLRYFAYFKQSRMMSEIRRTIAIPLTTIPPKELKEL